MFDNAYVDGDVKVRDHCVVLSPSPEMGLLNYVLNNVPHALSRLTYLLASALYVSYAPSCLMCFRTLPGFAPYVSYMSYLCTLCAFFACFAHLIFAPI